MEGMKEFFEQCLRDLHKLTGLKQYIEICNKPTQKEAEEEMAGIVAGMVRVSDKFNYIPQDAQKRVIAHQIVSDTEIYALNAKVVYKWLNAVSDKYWHESGHLETNATLAHESNAKPLSECSPETQRLVSDFKATLATAIMTVPKVSEAEIDHIKIEDEQRQQGALSVGIPFGTEQQLKRRELHLQWIKECTDKITGKLLPDAMDETEWLLNKGYFIENNEIKEL